MSEIVKTKMLEMPANARISSTRPKELREKAPGNTWCSKCDSDRVHISRSGRKKLSPLMRVFFIVYRCHTCGIISLHARPVHWLRRFLGGAKTVSKKVISNRQDVVHSRAKEFKQAKPDRNPVFQQRVADDQSIHLTIEPSFDIDPIVKAIKSNYTAKERELLASKFNEISVMVDPPIGVSIRAADSA